MKNLLFAAAALPLFLTVAPAQQLKVLTSNGVKAAAEEFFPKNAVPQFDTTINIRKKVEAGEAFDASVLTVEATDALIKEGKIDPSSRKLYARTGVGVGYHAGSPKPDVSTPEAFKKTLLAAKSITYNQQGASRQAIDKALAQLGIADQMKAKAIIETESGKPQMNVGEGKAELVLTLIPEIPVYKGVALAGPFPDALQSYTTFAFGVSTGSNNKAAAMAFVDAMTKPSLAAKLKSKGLEQQ